MDRSSIVAHLFIWYIEVINQIGNLVICNCLLRLFDPKLKKSQQWEEADAGLWYNRLKTKRVLQANIQTKNNANGKKKQKVQWWKWTLDPAPLRRLTASPPKALSSFYQIKPTFSNLQNIPFIPASQWASQPFPFLPISSTDVSLCEIPFLPLRL